MIERLAWRTEGFVASTAQRALHAVEGLLPDSLMTTVQPRRRRHSRRRGALPAAVGAAAAVAVGAASAAVRSRQGGPAPEMLLHRGGDTGAGHGPVDLARASREELYRLAREAGIAGRSQMTRDQLVRALSDR